jgi:hypothetical protein
MAVVMPADAFTPYLPAGQSRRKVRDFLLRHVNWARLSRQAVAEWFGEDITDDLLAKGLIEPARERIDDATDGEVIPGYYRVAEVGRRFASKLLIPPIPRAKAEQIVTDMLARADTINRNRELLYWIDKITLFGSYLTNAPVVGDIDVSVDIRCKARLVGEDWRKADWHELALARAEASGREFGSYDAAVDYPEKEVRRLLKARNRYLSVMSSVDVDKLDTPTPKRIVWPTAPSKYVKGPRGERYTSLTVIHALNGRRGRRGRRG